MKIPSTFKLAGLTISVVFDPLLHENRKLLGEAVYSKQQIVLDSGICSQEQIEQNFFHELLHWIYFIMSEDELRQNERIVDLSAHMLHQFMVTQTFEALAYQP
ncbi:MAG: hypothetical protein WCP10_15100 [Desulfuromonadales bacterium]